jgi:alpha-L-fucosidase
MKWFAEAEYGMFVVFGLYSHLAGEWKGEQVPWYGEWLQASKQIPREEYAAVIKEFYPEKFDADFIVCTAKEAGMKYLVIASKFHDGFCLWDSKYTDFDVASTPFKGRDILAELSEACKRHGLKFGIYYSIIDWNHPTQSPKDHTNSSPMRGWGQTVIEHGRKNEYITYQTNQLLELISNYHPDMLWFDGDWTDWWTMDDGIVLYNTLRKASPNLIVNNRVAKRNGFELDFVTQEQKHFEDVFPKHWEACYTMNESWGFKRNDDKWKDAQTIYDKLKDINEKGGNLLLNIGPDGQGIVPPESVAVLKETAELLKAKPIKKNKPIIENKPGLVK